MSTWQSVTLQIVAIYTIIGLSISFIVFLIAKLKQMDDKSYEWDNILNSVIAFVCFMLLGSVVGLPFLISTIVDHKRIGRSDVDPEMSSWWWHFMIPYRFFKKRISNFFE